MTIRNPLIKVRSVGSRGALESFRIRTEINRQTGVNNISDLPAKLVLGSPGEVKISFPVKSPGQIRVKLVRGLNRGYFTIILDYLRMDMILRRK